MTDLERVARTIWESIGDVEPSWDDALEESRESFREMARTALSALIPPSEGMERAAVANMFTQYDDAPWEDAKSVIEDLDLAAIFTAAINHVLEGKDD